MRLGSAGGGVVALTTIADQAGARGQEDEEVEAGGREQVVKVTSTVDFGTCCLLIL